MYRVLAILIWMFSSSFSSSQSTSWSWAADLQFGSLIKHSPKIKFHWRGPSTLVQASLIYECKGLENWAVYYNLPRFGLTGFYQHLGWPTDILGRSFAIYPFADFRFWNTRKSSWHLLVGSGISYVDKKYHPVSNPLQLNIGSHLNNITRFGWSYEYLLRKNLSLSVSLNMIHHSNGGFKAPNLGLNFVGLQCGLIGLGQRASPGPIPDSLTRIKWAVAVHPFVAWSTIRVIGGPKFRTSGLAGDLYFFYNSFKALSAGVEYEFNPIGAYFISHTANRSLPSENKGASRRLLANLGHQWLIGDLGIEAKLGFQLLKSAQYYGLPFYTKLAAYYYVPRRFVFHSKIYTGIQLKTHYGTAQYIAWVLGCRFGRV